MTKALTITRHVSAPFEENCYIVRRPDLPECFVIDPGFESDALLAKIANLGLTVVAIVNTHSHLDHIAGNEAVKNAFPNAPIIIGENEADMLTDPYKNLSAMIGMPVVSPPADRTVAEGDSIDLLGLPWEVREIPGHSPGHVVYIWHDAAPAIVFGGDVLMQGSVGRTDFPGGSFEQLLEGIHAKLYTLPDDTMILPGHGAATTTGQERRTNPFTSGRVRL